ncbi:hypothetical protein EHF33_01135 [Deinococcus psychrotolerans]|uniref:Uncharacterized protein n=1 Tax=Deinococcus psychrotolerans TaxID=2489213 RepID=A0A3G8Y824_9DEIO|nr:hypothetical protein [Deinococcus psychrotolerans]AZI41529.1 hypothetical protein EHF33_01135 [Deinococcus psychrotolerans]
MIPSLRATHTASELVTYLWGELGLKIMLSSSGEDEIMEQELEYLRRGELKLWCVASGEVKASKPATNIVAAALGKLGAGGRRYPLRRRGGSEGGRALRSAAEGWRQRETAG